MSDYSVAFHIGAHKTASTYLKNAIQSNKKLCREAGIKFIPSWKYRKEFMPLEALIESGGNIVQILDAFRTQLDTHAAESRRVLISEENTLVLKKPFGEAELYPLADERFGRFRSLIGARQTDVFLSIRDYSTFLPSLYGQYIRHNQYLTFDEFIDQTSLHEISWPRLVNRILHETHEADRIFVWSFETFVKDPTSALKAILSITDLKEFSFPEGVVRQGLSMQAMQAVEDQMLLSKSPWAKGAIAAAAEQFPIDQGYPKYQPFSQAERSRLSERYQEELLQLGSRGDVTFLG